HLEWVWLSPLWVDTVEKVVSDPPKRNNRIRTARYLNRNCVRGRDFESMLRIQGRKIVFQQYRSLADISPRNRHVRFTLESGYSAVRYGPKSGQWGFRHLRWDRLLHGRYASASGHFHLHFGGHSRAIFLKGGKDLGCRDHHRAIRHEHGCGGARREA